MAVSTDQLVEAFSAKLVERGRSVIQLDDEKARSALFRVYQQLQKEAAIASEDKAWNRVVVATRNLFAPSSIGAFDDFESVMRAKQIYMTDHPNPYYTYISIKIPIEFARVIIGRLPKNAQQLVDRMAETFLAEEKVIS